VEGGGGHARCNTRVYLVVLPSGNTFPYCTTLSTLDAFAPAGAAEALANGRAASAGHAADRAARLRQRSICGKCRLQEWGDIQLQLSRLLFRRRTADNDKKDEEVVVVVVVVEEEEEEEEEASAWRALSATDFKKGFGTVLS
jgi:hypothetical protein